MNEEPFASNMENIKAAIEEYLTNSGKVITTAIESCDGCMFNPCDKKVQAEKNKMRVLGCSERKGI